MFHILLGIHIFSGVVCLLTGLLAGMAKKKKGLHTIVGEIYHGSFLFVFLSAVIMSILHWSESAYLFYIALFSYGLALFGYVAAKRKKKGWIRWHISGMCGSYIGITTATIVVNIPHIPVLKDLPSLIFWFLPTVVGSPIIYVIGKKYRPRKKK